MSLSKSNSIKIGKTATEITLYTFNLKCRSSSLRNSYHKLQQPFRKTNTCQTALPFSGPALWNKVPDEIKRTTNLNAFKHNLKKHYLKELGKSNF